MFIVINTSLSIRLIKYIGLSYYGKMSRCYIHAQSVNKYIYFYLKYAISVWSILEYLKFA